MDADFIIAKYESAYGAKSIVDFLRALKSTLINRTNLRGLSPELSVAELSNQRKRISSIINTELDHIGVSQKVIGWKYLIDAIALAVNHKQNNISTIMGAKYNKTNSSVERAMQNEINTAWRASDIDDSSKYYTAKIMSQKEVPTFMEFISYYANRISDN